eukprot:319185-Chlamydomonas_euryale.AAC.2
MAGFMWPWPQHVCEFHEEAQKAVVTQNPVGPYTVKSRSYKERTCPPCGGAPTCYLLHNCLPISFRAVRTGRPHCSVCALSLLLLYAAGVLAWAVQSQLLLTERLECQTNWLMKPTAVVSLLQEKQCPFSKSVSEFPVRLCMSKALEYSYCFTLAYPRWSAP